MAYQDKTLVVGYTCRCGNAFQPCEGVPLHYHEDWKERPPTCSCGPTDEEVASGQYINQGGICPCQTTVVQRGEENDFCSICLNWTSLAYGGWYAPTKVSVVGYSCSCGDAFLALEGVSLYYHDDWRSRKTSCPCGPTNRAVSSGQLISKHAMGGGSCGCGYNYVGPDEIDYPCEVCGGFSASVHDDVWRAPLTMAEKVVELQNHLGNVLRENIALKDAQKAFENQGFWKRLFWTFRPRAKR